MRLVLARALLAGAQLRCPGDDARLELLVEPPDLLLGALPFGDVLADPEDAQRLVAGAAQEADVPQHDVVLPVVGVQHRFVLLHRLAVEDSPDHRRHDRPALRGKKQLGVVLPQHVWRVARRRSTRPRD